MSKLNSEKICVVCGDKSLGFNFNVLSCESCKAFFRRNAVSNKKISCPFANNCEITVITRRFCQKCRLEKCFQVGMKKEYIMSEEDKELKRQKIEQNRNKRKLKIDSDDECKANRMETKKVKEESVSSIKSSIQSDDSIDESLGYLSLSPNSNVAEIVTAITESKSSSSVIQHVMKNQDAALKVMSKIINDPNQALLFISHLIKNPENGMLILSKMMAKSPLDALTVFTQFMSSPLNALQIIFKVVSSPHEILRFMEELTITPQNAMEIMQRFMTGPAESFQNISEKISKLNVPGRQAYCHNETIKSMLDISSLDSPKSISSMSSPSTANSPYYNDSNNNDYQQVASSILKEISQDVNSTKPFKINSIDSIINEAIKLEYNTPETISQIQNPCRELNEIETMKIQELLDANCALYAPVEDDHLSFLGFRDNSLRPEASQLIDPILLKVINLTAVAIRRLIKMSKKISGFKKMCQEDQIALLKGGCTEMMILRSIMQYDSDNALWKIPSMNMANLRADILKLCPKGNVYEEHENFIKTFDLRLRTDERVVLILCAITLFSPDRANVIHQDVIKLEQNSYYFLLRRYLESIYDGCEARSIFLHLLKKVEEVRRLNEEVISVYLDVNPSQVEPLLREIFDLKV